jgi:hypothetical protein
MKIKIVLSLILILNISVFSQDEFSKVATGTAQFLKLGAGARGTALGDAYTALTKDVSAMYWNPAGIQKINNIAIAASQTELFVGIKYNFFGAVSPLDENSRIGVSVLYLSSGEMEVNTIDSPQGTGEFFSTSHSSWGITYSRRLTERFDLGVTVKYIIEKLYLCEASTIAFDIGSQFDTGIYGLKIGMLLANFGGKMKFDGPILDHDIENPETGVTHGSGGRLKTEDWPIPLLFRLGVYTDIIGGDSEYIKNEDNRLTVSVEGNDPVDHNLHYNFGAEYEWNKIIALRLGYKMNYDEQNFTCGMGLDFSKVGINARLDYAFNDYGMLGYVHNYSLEFYF